MIDIINNVQFNIDCCTACSQIIRGNISSKDCKNTVLTSLNEKYNCNISNEELFVIAKNIYKENLANDKYGINNLKEVYYA